MDPSGSAYVTGTTTSPDFPTANPLKSAPSGFEAFVTKLAPAGNALVYSTYLGGDGLDFGQAIATDASGNAYVTGHTYSSDFPVASPVQSALAASGQSDAFVTKLDPNGSAFVYSTYLGGSEAETGEGIAVDSSGHAYVTGGTFSTDFPAVSALQTAQSNYEAARRKAQNVRRPLLLVPVVGPGLLISQVAPVKVEEAYQDDHAGAAPVHHADPHQAPVPGGAIHDPAPRRGHTGDAEAGARARSRLAAGRRAGDPHAALADARQVACALFAYAYKVGVKSLPDGQSALEWALDGHGIVMRAEWDIARYLKSGRLRPVLEYLVGREYNNAGIRKKLAQMAFAEERFEDAVRWAREALYIDVKDAEVHKLLADGYLKTGQPEKARRELEVLLELSPDNAEVKGLLESLGK